MNHLESFFRWFVGLFTSPKGQAVLSTIANLAQQAEPIVEIIAAATPNKTDDEILAAYKQYGVPVMIQLANNNQKAAGAALLDLATTLLQRKVGSGVAWNVLNSAAQLAYSAYKAKAA